MHQYSVRDVERLVHLPRSRIRSLVEAGFVSPARGPRNAWRFSFQDLIVLRTVQALAEAKVPHKRITSSVKELRRRLPDSMPLSGLTIAAEANSVVVREGTRCWQAESGQYLLGFQGNPAEGSLSVLERQGAEPPAGAEDWFDRGAALETEDPQAAIEAYERAIAVGPGLLKARINLGCLLHETGRLDRAEAVYREAMRAAGGDDPVLLYDLGIVLDDMGRSKEAMEAYRAALREDPRFADCHYNLALLCERLGQRKDAIQHMAAYRRLTATTRSE
jgi:tetratricopeptide (TPR) repeat protein